MFVLARVGLMHEAARVLEEELRTGLFLQV